MMSNYFSYFIQVILIITLIVILFLLARMVISMNKEKRITRFAIDALSNKPVSFFDRINNFYNRIVRKLSSLLRKSSLFVKYSNKYEKYIDQTAINRKNSIDFVSNKFLIAIMTVIITIISDVLRIHKVSILQLIVAFIIGFYILDVFLIIEHKRRLKIMEEDSLKAIIIMNNAFKSGRSIMQAIELVSQEITGPVADEFKKMYIDLTYGLDLETVFKRLSERVEIDEMKYVASSLIILNKTGGNVGRVFSSIEKGVFDRKKLKDELKATTALSEMVYKILVAMPLLIFIVIIIFSPTYFDPLFNTVIGKIVLVLILILYLLYIIIVKKVTKVKGL